MLAPNVHMVSRIEIYIWPRRSCSPFRNTATATAAQNITKDIEIKGESSNVVLATAQCPIHQRVVLCRNAEFSRIMGFDMNYVLRQYRHRLRCQVPTALWEFEPISETFAANSAIESLTFSKKHLNR
jgi:hypothetical protein